MQEWRLEGWEARREAWRLGGWEAGRLGGWEGGRKSTRLKQT